MLKRTGAAVVVVSACSALVAGGWAARGEDRPKDTMCEQASAYADTLGTRIGTSGAAMSTTTVPPKSLDAVSAWSQQRATLDKLTTEWRDAYREMYLLLEQNPTCFPPALRATAAAKARAMDSGVGGP